MDKKERFSVPVSALCFSGQNVRKTAVSKAEDAQLYASLCAQGVLQNLIVSPPNEEGLYPVEGGGRRLKMLQRMVKKGVIPADYPVPVRLVDAVAASEVSLVENFARANMHPVDEFDAFTAMITQEGATLADVAQRFGVTQRFVKQRMALSAVHPTILTAYRHGETTLDKVMAFTVADPERQLTIWEAVKSWHSLSPANIRLKLKAEAVTETFGLLTFIGGKAAYVKAGGVVTKDLFGDDEYFDDRALIESLAREKLAPDVNALRESGWGWVEVILEPDYEPSKGFSELRDTEESDDFKAIAGCKLLPNYRGEFVTVSGLVKKSDRGSLAKLRKLQSLEAKAVTDKSHEDAPSEPLPARYSGALCRDLADHHLLITQHTLMSNPMAGLDLLLYSVCVAVFDGKGKNPLAIEFKSTVPHGDNLTGNQAIDNINAFRSALPLAWLDQPNTVAAFRDFCALNEQDKARLLAFVSASVTKANPSTDSVDSSVTQAIIADLSPDWSAYWRPNATAFFNRISVDEMIEIAKPVMSTAWCAVASSKKKNVLAAEMAAMVSGEAAGLTEQQRQYFLKWMPQGFEVSQSVDDLTASSVG